MMSDLPIKPVWDDTVELPGFPPLSRDLTVDAAVIGAGITGITTALLLQDAGLRVALLERRRVGGVNTGCTTAHLTAVVDRDLPALAKTFGFDHAQAVWDAGFAAIDQIETLIARHGIRCEFARVPGFRCVATDADESTRTETLGRLRAEAAMARDLGFDVEMVTAAPLVGQPGWRIDHQALFHPGQYAAGLLSRLTDGDAVVCSDCDVSFEAPDRLSAGGFHVDAPIVILATHTPLAGRQTAAAAGILQSKLAAYTSYALAADVGDPVDALPSLAWDTASPYHYLRTDRQPGGVRIIAGGDDHKTGQEPDTHQPFAQLETWFRRLVPAAAITHRWSGQVLETPDGLPLIGEVADRQYVATGYAGNGMTFGTLAAMMIRDAITGVKNPWRDLFDVNRSAAVRGPLNYLRENADYPYYMIRDRFAGVGSRALRRLGRGDGQLVEVNGEVVAASRDADGRLSLLSPTCTHLGCRVAWNTTEKTWDCPCHGSRFTGDGAVLSGPAERPLAPAQVGTAAQRTTD
jgi:glycine/D-amino acid oxidase-like deaminating enzyme/nitrite reductase/ring-hydroxylating ferredoxin subunit